MARMQSLRVFVCSTLVCLVTLAACDSKQMIEAPVSQASFTNGPDDLLNVYRYVDTDEFFGIQDPAADLRIFAGLPGDLSTSVLCGGSEEFDLDAHQVVGFNRGVLHDLVRNVGPQHLHVYRRSTFTGLCNSTPLATGWGQWVVTDNDFMGVSGRRSSFGGTITGAVSYATGGQGRVAAHVRVVFLSDGTPALVQRSINLTNF